MDIQTMANNILANAQGLVTDMAKKELFNYVQTKGFGTLKDVAEAYSVALQESASNSSGWIYIRDKFFLPCLISVGISILSGVMEQIAAEMAKENV